MNLGSLADKYITQLPVKHINNIKDLDRKNKCISCVCIPKLNGKDKGVYVDKEMDIKEYYSIVKNEDNIELKLIIKLLKSNSIISNEENSNMPLLFSVFSLFHEEGHYDHRKKFESESDERYIKKYKEEPIEITDAKGVCDKLRAEVGEKIAEYKKKSFETEEEKNKMKDETNKLIDKYNNSLEYLYILNRNQEVEKFADDYAIKMIKNNKIKFDIEL